MIMRILIFFLAALCILFVIQNHQYPHVRHNALSDRLLHPFDTRLRFKIAQIDPQFMLSKADLIRLSHDAIDIWHTGTGHDLLVYDENARFQVKVIYDERQKNYLAQKDIEKKLQYDDQTHQRNADNIMLKREDLDRQQQVLLQQKSQIEAAHNQLRQQLQHTASAQAQQHLLNELQQLSSEANVLNQRAAYLQHNIDQFNQEISQFQQQIHQHQHNIQQARQQFPPREFHKGVFNGREIHIYQFSNQDDLRLTLAHELGHALGLKHHQDPEGLMYPQLEHQLSQGFKLRSSDLDLFQSRYEH